MIEEKLENARLRHAKRRIYLGVGLFAAIVLCGLVVIGLSILDFSQKTTPAVSSPKKKLSETVTEKLREEFKKELEQYETQLAPRLEFVNLEGWNQDVFFEITQLKKKVMSDFASTEYGKAMDNLQLLVNLTVKVLEEADLLFEQNLEKAATFLAEDRYDEAKFYIEKALQINSASSDALKLQQKIDKLAPTLSLLKGAKVAQAENDLQKEYDFLQQVLTIAPEREGVMDRLRMLSGLIKTQKFDGHISSGFADIEKRRAKQARTHYQKAKGIDSQRVELSLLENQLLALEGSLRVEQAVKQAEKAIRQDDWLKARTYFAKAAEDAPENKRVVQGLRRADHNLRILAEFSHFFKYPYRLAHADVRKKARQTLVEAQAASNYSFAIKRQAKKLNDLIVKINRPVPVTVFSDNNTYVLVRSIGRVGVVSQKTIELKPGNYTFEGTRKGFKSKLMKAFIPYDQNDFSVVVICDEPI